MAGLRFPLSTLHVQPRDCTRMTRGRDGSLRLSRRALSSPTLCRFIPALTTSPSRTCPFLFPGADGVHDLVKTLEEA
jgi:hypothetical protein